MIPFSLRLIREQNRIYGFTLKLISRIQKGVEVYLFHDLVDNITEESNQFVISQQSFELFLLKCIERGKKPLNFEEISGVILKKSKLRSGFIVTFDDCNTSVYTKAYPFLKKHNIPFVLFITVELIGKDNFLTKEQIVEMANDPLCTIGSHAVHHKMFRYLTEEEATKELIESKQYLQQLTGQTIDCFAFPYGRLIEVSCMNIRSLKRSDYLFAFSAVYGNLNHMWLSGKYFLPRMNVGEDVVIKKLKSN